MSDIIEDIWELGPEPHKDWFHHWRDNYIWCVYLCQLCDIGEAKPTNVSDKCNRQFDSNRLVF